MAAPIRGLVRLLVCTGSVRPIDAALSS